MDGFEFTSVDSEVWKVHLVVGEVLVPCKVSDFRLFRVIVRGRTFFTFLHGHPEFTVFQHRSMLTDLGVVQCMDILLQVLEVAPVLADVVSELPVHRNAHDLHETRDHFGKEFSDGQLVDGVRR